MSATKGLLFVTTCVLTVTICAGVGSLLFPFGTTNGDTVLPGGDDRSNRKDLTTPFQFYDISLNPIYVSTNGIITDRYNTDYSPNGDLSDPTNYAWPTISVYHYDLKAIAASGFFFRETNGTIDLQITMQVALVTSATVNVVLFLYDNVDITFNSLRPVIGVTAGDGINYEELNVSRTTDVLTVDERGQGSTLGLYGFIVNTDVDECALETANCSSIAVCENTDGSFTCTCNAGYSGDGVTCSDVDECALETTNCSSIAVCENTDGSFTCTCNAGYSGDGVTCSDVDECALETTNCSSIAVCENARGSFTCNCTAGYSGDGVTCSDIDECTLGTHTCKANKICSNTVGSYFCRCKRG